MLNCEYCDYFSKAQASKGNEARNGCSCEFANHRFRAEELTEAVEHPCSTISYQEYLSFGRKKTAFSEAG
jgi:hypothetical protein